MRRRTAIDDRGSPIDRTIWRLVGVAALLMPLNGLAAATSLYGVPEPPTPMPLPTAWLAIQDDMFGDAVLDTDDFRTGGAHLGLSLGGFVATVKATLFNRYEDPGALALLNESAKPVHGFVALENLHKSAAELEETNA